MKNTSKILFAMLLSFPILVHAQEKKDSSSYLNGMLKIVTNENNDGKSVKKMELSTPSSKKKKRKPVETNWGGFNLGFNNYTDKTDYTNTSVADPNSIGSFALLPKAAQENDFELKSGKSVNVNFGIVRQQVSLYKNYVSIIYGLCYDINNWSYKKSIHWTSIDQTNASLSSLSPNNKGYAITMDSVNYTKNKLVTNYLQVPLLLRFETSPNHSSRNVCLSIGGYAGYLVRSHTKQIVEGSNQKEKQFNDFNLNKFQYGMQAELEYKQFAIYFKNSLTPLTSYGTEQYPYCFGVRLSN